VGLAKTGIDGTALVSLMANHVCFPEPDITDSTWAARGESVLEWLQRSTHPRAAEVRRFLNRNIACLPKDARVSFCSALKKKPVWESALFELVVARTLQLLGASLRFEQANVEGRRPDFAARFGEHSVVVEAIAPQFDQAMTLRKKKHEQVLDIIESRVPEGWTALLESVPDFGFSESKTELKRALEGISHQPPPRNTEHPRRIRLDLPQGTLKLTLIPGRFGRAIGGGPVYVTGSDAKQRIRYALNKKRSQVRAESQPVLLAILGSGTAGFDDFDEVLFGHPAIQLGPDPQACARFFKASGEFARRSGEPTYSGVLALTDLGPFGCRGPVLFVHPRSAGALPDEFAILETRSLSANGIEILPTADRGLLDDLDWPTL
jgi:hypothetical protein